MARAKPTSPYAPAKSDAYTGLLIISLLALIAGCVFLYLDLSQYKNPKPPPLPGVGGARAPGGGQVGQGGAAGQVGGAAGQAGAMGQMGGGAMGQMGGAAMGQMGGAMGQMGQMGQMAR